MTIKKVDADNSNVVLSNAVFIIAKSNGKWLTKRGNTYGEVDTRAQATRFTTDSNGTCKLSMIPNGSYSIYEITQPSGYDITLQQNYNSTNNWIKCTDVTISNGIDQSRIITNKKYGTITITKKDKDTNKNLQAGFKIHVGNFNYIGLDSNGEWIYNSTFKNAYTFVTGKADSNCKWITVSDGTITIKKLKLSQTYEILEVEAPNGYNLTQQSRYTTVTDSKKDIGKKYSYVYYGNTTLNSNKLSAVFNLTNIRTISVKGHVWIDKQVGKNYESNSLFDSNDLKVAGIKVRLMKKGTTPTQVGETTYTDSNGEYIFNNLISENDINSYYVEFDYNGVKANVKDIYGNTIEEDISKYIPVAFNATDINGSKAIMNSLPEKDADLTGIAMTYTGTDATALSKYGLGKIGTLKDGTLSNINLGIKKIPTPDYNLTENIAYVKIVMKGYTYTYIYGGQGDTSRIAAPQVQFGKQGTISSYTANIYPSDISYDIKNSTEELKMYINYRIDITNTMKYNNEELYKEKTLHILSLTDTFDKNRYILNDDNWTVEENGNVATIKESYLEDIKNTGINLNEPTKTKYIGFTVKHDAIAKILDKLNNPNGIIEENPTKVNAIGYHKYTRKDYSWENKIIKEQDHITLNRNKEANAPYLIFKLGQERIISGKVFKDRIVTTDGQVLGNGEYDNGEKGIADVNVELLDLNGTETDVTKLSVSNVYGVEGYGNDLSKIAQVKTKEDGSYSLNGVVPGYYYLRFVYGNGDYKITDLKGNVINTSVGSKIDNIQINPKYYKSTIVTNQTVKSALLGGNDVEWYKILGNDKVYSVALDNLEQRRSVNEGTINNMMAGTSKMSITIENTQTKEAEVEQNAKYDEQGKEIIQEQDKLEFPTKNEFTGLSFGIIEQPKQEAEIKKIITNVRLTNSQGNVLYNGNPENVPSQGVVALADLDNEENGGSTYVRTEMQETSLYGAILELTYEVKVTNKSDINYYINDYYWYGDKKDGKKEVTLTPIDVRDYLDETLTYLEEKSDKDRVTLNGTKNITVDEKSVKVQEMKLKGWHTLYTKKNASRKVEDTTDKIIIVAGRVMTNNDEDMEVISRAEIKDMIHTPDPSDSDLPTKENEVKEQIRIAPKEVHTNGMIKAKFTLTPPTGENRSAIYVIAGIIALIILSTGIVVIKKKVL